MPIIKRNRSLIPACDVSFETYKNILSATRNNDKVMAYKIGPALTGRLGYDRIVELSKVYANGKLLIYDGQKWGTDIPDTAKAILSPLKESGIDAVILFPLSGKNTQESWIKTAQDLGLGVIVGGEMTHKGFLRSEGGYFTEDDTDGIYRLAAKLGVEDFVVPGNKPKSISRIRGVLEKEGISASFYSSGFVAQEGEISEGAKAAGERFHAIVGRGMLENGPLQANIEKSIERLVRDL
jgi:orotidine-5'-phosphate decarboxylase